MRRQHGGDRLEHGIARRMAVPVVDRLEAVEVDVEQRRAGAVALHVGERARKLAVEAAPVEDPGDRVDVRGRLELLHPGARGRKFALEALQLAEQDGEFGGNIAGGLERLRLGLVANRTRGDCARARGYCPGPGRAPLHRP